MPRPANDEDLEDTVAVVSDTQAKPTDVKCEDLKEGLDIDTDNNDNLPKVASEDLLKCERCGQDVSVWEMPEHNDYHFALDLQNAFSSSTDPAAVSSSSSTSTTTSSSVSHTPLRVGPAGAAQSSRGKTKTRGQSGPTPKRHRAQGGSTGTLDSFFKRK